MHPNYFFFGAGAHQREERDGAVTAKLKGREGLESGSEPEESRLEGEGPPPFPFAPLEGALGQLALAGLTCST